MIASERRLVPLARGEHLGSFELEWRMMLQPESRPWDRTTAQKRRGSSPQSIPSRCGPEATSYQTCSMTGLAFGCRWPGSIRRVSRASSSPPPYRTHPRVTALPHKHLHALGANVSQHHHRILLDFSYIVIGALIRGSTVSDSVRRELFLSQPCSDGINERRSQWNQWLQCTEA